MFRISIHYLKIYYPKFNFNFFKNYQNFGFNFFKRYLYFDFVIHCKIIIFVKLFNFHLLMFIIEFLNFKCVFQKYLFFHVISFLFVQQLLEFLDLIFNLNSY